MLAATSSTEQSAVSTEPIVEIESEDACTDSTPEDPTQLLKLLVVDHDLSPANHDAIGCKMNLQETPIKPSHHIDLSVARTPRPMGKILFLDGLRGLAAMMVVVQHVGYMGLPVGQPAVDTFFVLSAFLLTLLFEKRARALMEQNASYRRWGLALLDYFVRRFLRVYPLFAIVAIYLTVYSPSQKEKLFFVHQPEEYNVFRVLVFEFKFRYHVFWTLPLEISYYFIIPVFVVLILKLKKLWLLPMLPLTYLVIYSGLHWPRGDHMPLKPHLPTFLCGSMAAIVYSKLDQWIQRHQFVFRWFHTLILRTIEMVSLALLCSTFFEGLLFHWVFTNPIPQTPGGHFVSATLSVILVCEMLRPGAISSLLEWSLLRYAGKVSFSMYLLHSFVIYSDWVRAQGFYDKLVAVCVPVARRAYRQGDPRARRRRAPARGREAARAQSVQVRPLPNACHLF